MTSTQKTESSKSINVHRKLNLDDKLATLTETVSDDERKVKRRIVVPAPKRKPPKPRLPLAERQSREEMEAYRIFQQETGQHIKPDTPRPDKRKLRRITRAEGHLKSEQERVAAAVRQSQREVSMIADDEDEEGEYDDENFGTCICNTRSYQPKESCVSQRELDREIDKAEAAIRNEQELENVMDNIDEYYSNVRDELEGLRETAIENRLRGLEGFRELTRDSVEYGDGDRFIDVEHEAEMTRVGELIEKMSNKLLEQRRNAFEDGEWDPETCRAYTGLSRMAAGMNKQQDAPKRTKAFDIVTAKKRLKDAYMEAIEEAKGRIKKDNDLANYLEYLSNDHDTKLKALIKLGKRQATQKAAGPPVEPIKLQLPVARPGRSRSSTTPTRGSIVGKRAARKLSLSSIPEKTLPTQRATQAEISAFEDQSRAQQYLKAESKLKEQVNMISQIERLKLAAKAKLLRDSQGSQQATKDPGELQRTLVDLRSNLIENLTGRIIAVDAQDKKKPVATKCPKMLSREEQIKIARQIEAQRVAQVAEAGPAVQSRSAKMPSQYKKSSTARSIGSRVAPTAPPKSAPTAKSLRISLTAEQQIAIAREMAREMAARRDEMEKSAPAQRIASTRKSKTPAAHHEALRAVPPKGAPTANAWRTSLTAEQQIAIARSMAREMAARREAMEKSIVQPKTARASAQRTASATAHLEASRQEPAIPAKSAPKTKLSRASLTAEQQIAIARSMAREAAARREEIERSAVQPKTPRESASAHRMAGTSKLKFAEHPEAAREAPASKTGLKAKSSRTSLTAEQQIAIARSMAREAAARREEMERSAVQPKTPWASASAQRMAGTSNLKSAGRPEAAREAPAPKTGLKAKSSRTSLTAEQQIAIARSMAREAAARREEMERSAVQPKTPWASASAQRMAGTSNLKSAGRPEAAREAPAPKTGLKAKSSRTSLTAEQQIAIARSMAREMATRREEMEKSVLQSKTPRASASAQRMAATSKLKSAGRPEAPAGPPPKSAPKAKLTAKQQVEIARSIAKEVAAKYEEMQKSIVQPKTPFKTPRASASAQRMTTNRKPKTFAARPEAFREAPAAPPKTAPKPKSRSFLTAEQQIAIARAIARGEAVQLPQVPESPVKKPPSRVSLVAQQTARTEEARHQAMSMSTVQPKAPKLMPARPPTTRPSRTSLMEQQATKAQTAHRVRPFGVPPPSETALRVASTKKLLASASRTSVSIVMPARPPKSGPSARSSRVSLVAQQKSRPFGVPPPSQSALRVASSKKLLASASRTSRTMPPKSAPTVRPTRVSLMGQQAARAETSMQVVLGQRSSRRSLGVPPPSKSVLRVAGAPTKKLLASTSRPSVSRITPKTAPTARSSRVSLVAQQAARAKASRETLSARRESKSEKTGFGVAQPTATALRVAAAKKMSRSRTDVRKVDPNELSVKAKEDYEAQKELAKRLITDDEMYQDHLQYLEEDYSSKLHFIKNMETYKSSAEKQYMKDVQAARASIRDKDILKERLDHLKEDLNNKKAYIEEAAGMSRQRAVKSSAAEVKDQLRKTIHQMSTGKTPKQGVPSVSRTARAPYRFFDTPKGRPSLLRKPTRTTLLPPSASKRPPMEVAPTQSKSDLEQYQKYLQVRQNVEELYKDDPQMLEHHLQRVRGEYDARMNWLQEENPDRISTLYKTPGGARKRKSLPAISALKSVRSERGIPTLQARKSTTPIKSLQKARVTTKSAQGVRSLLAPKLTGKNVKEAQGKTPVSAAQKWKVPVSIRGAIRKEKKLEKSLNELEQVVESNKEFMDAVEGAKPMAPISRTSLAPLAARMGLEPDKQVEQVLGKATKRSRAIKQKMSSIPPTVAGMVQQKDHSSVSPLAAEEADGIFKMMMNEDEGINLSGEPGEIVRLIVPSEGPTLPVTGNAVESLSKGVITGRVPVREINALSNRNAEDFASTVKQQPKHKFPMESIATKRLQKEPIEVPPVGEPRSKEDYIQHDLLLHSFEVENFFQARGTTFPKWFPGIYTVFPEESPKLVLKKSPSEILHRAWQIMKPKYAQNSP